MLALPMLASLAYADGPACASADWFKAELCEDPDCAVQALGPTCAAAVSDVLSCVSGARVDDASQARELCRDVCATAIGADSCDADPHALESMTWIALPTCTAIADTWPDAAQGRGAVKKQVGSACFSDLSFMVDACQTTQPDPSDPDAAPLPDPSPSCLARCGRAWPLPFCQDDWTGLTDSLRAWDAAMQPPARRPSKKDTLSLLAVLGAYDGTAEALFGPSGLGEGGLGGVGMLGVEGGDGGLGGLGWYGASSDGGGFGARGTGGGSGSALGYGSLSGSGAAPTSPPTAPPALRPMAQGEFGHLTGRGSWVCAAEDSAVRCFGPTTIVRPLTEPVLDLALGGDTGAQWLIGATASGVWTHPLDASARPPTAPALAGVRHVSAGADFACAATAVDTTCWGANDQGTLGDGSRFVRTGPVRVSGLPSVDELVSGRDFTCATHGDALRCWGALYAVGYDPSGLPVSIDLRGATHLEASSARFCARLGDDGVACGHERPLLFPGATALAVSSRRECAVVDAHVVCRGVEVPETSGVRAVAMTEDGVCLIDAQGLSCWGRQP